MIELFVLCFIAWKIYEAAYYKGRKFNALRMDLNTYVANCNELNDHIEELKQTYSGIKKNNYGTAQLSDESRYNFKRTEQVNAKKSEYIYDCSSTVCKNAEQQPFKYLCKYFNIKATEETLESFENVLNNFLAAEDGKELLMDELESIKESIQNDIPFLIRKLGMKKFMMKLGFKEVDLSTLYFPVYTFRYVSPGGNKTSVCNIELDIDNLTDFVQYLSEIVKFKKSAAGQRALMTKKLREKIKKRDGYTCQKCRISTKHEKNLLLEIDHIIPISRGGLSTEDNL